MHIEHKRLKSGYIAFVIVLISLIGAAFIIINKEEVEEVPDVDNLTLYNFYGKEKYDEMNRLCNDIKQIEVAKEIIKKAKSVMEGTCEDENVGELKRYKYKDEVGSFPYSTCECNISLITTGQKENSGYVWVNYSVFYKDENGNDVSGVSDAVSRWTIEKQDNKWIVTKIEEM